MTKYIGFAVGGADDPAWADPERAEQALQAYLAWDERLRAQGRLLGGAGLADEAKVLRRNGDGVVVSTGPFAEAPDVIGGYAVFEAESMDEAVELCKDHPHLEFGYLEIRELTLE
ncbi:YciI family protein [Amycolatopsis aidingensis]|uniref:YciI family protein n=1 Tax=Amycolatopsis aidingensis TaxID=2842453 RepID=UPI001C0CF049|nr:YciI family protein [Amycolatopsis aidingensis]